SLRSPGGGTEGSDASAAASKTQPRPRFLFSAEQLPAYAEFCRRNILLLLAGATPDYYLFGMPDGHVNGLALVVERSGRSTPLYLSQISLRPGMPLQSGLFSLAQTAARSLASQGIQLDELESLGVALMVLFDPAMHGTVADPHLAGTDSRQRAILITERNKSGLVFDPTSSSMELLGRVAELARVTHPASAAVFSLEALS